MPEAWDLSCPDWAERLRAGRMPVPYLPLIAAEAEIAVAFFDQLRLPDVPGNPMLADAAGDWARQTIAILFGSYDPALCYRYIEEVFALIGKKNSKTTYFGAAGMLTALFMNRRPRARIIAALDDSAGERHPGGPDR